MACGSRCVSSPLHLGAFGNSSIKGLNPYSSTSLPSSSSSSSPPSVVEVVCKKRERGERGDRETFAPYYVTVITPPPRNLGIHSLPPNTQCGETVEVKGEPYVVSGVTYRYQLRRGKYQPSEKRLDVQSLGRYFVNLYFDNLLDTS
ncbi:uncharacterized protein [Physcomitrium patens]|uniref:Uncharacterized protein n=1 Tax=Physcomitrium patens TaxID=3218 RepID=A0A2K1JRF8_PHYPA|nr:hypothetical protein PHYPA_016502 [Physcomitrium patens]